jgi:hypothetical protein
MAVKVVNYSKLIENIKEMINVLEYDGTRSPGKIKLNSSTLVNLYELKDRYSEMVEASTPKAPAAPKAPRAKKQTNQPAKSAV